MVSCPNETGEMATILNLKKFNGKNFTIKNFHQMPAMTKIFYNELFSHEYFQQQIFPKLQYYT